MDDASRLGGGDRGGLCTPERNAKPTLLPQPVPYGMKWSRWRAKTAVDGRARRD